jgi:hypothetical protein
MNVHHPLLFFTQVLLQSLLQVALHCWLTVSLQASQAVLLSLQTSMQRTVSRPLTSQGAHVTQSPKHPLSQQDKLLLIVALLQQSSYPL